MKAKHFSLLTIMFGCSAAAFAQAAPDALRWSPYELHGTARFMSMGGAFGALGGDMSVLSQNPGGIGVYRSNEIGITCNLSMNSTGNMKGATDASGTDTKFHANTTGGILTLKLNSQVMPNINFGFTYNRTANFNSKTGGSIGALSTSMTNWMAGVANNNQLTVGDVSFAQGYNPYNPTDGGYAAPWIAILAYDTGLINPIGNPDAPDWQGQWGNDTNGKGYFSQVESGGVDSYNIGFGGNFANKVFWGMDFDITSISYSRSTYWEEMLNNAYVESDHGIRPTMSDWNLRNSYYLSGTGFNYKLGVIVKPIQQLRFGIAFHTPTYYKLNQEFIASADYKYGGSYSGGQDTNEGDPGYSDFRYHTPWKVIVSAAGVIGSKFIISADYEWAKYSGMCFKDPGYYYYDYVQPADSYDADGTNAQIKEYYRNTSTLRLGAEYRITGNFSVRAGYSYSSSPVKDRIMNGDVPVSTAGTNPAYTLPKATNYVTCGLGYRSGGFYGDIAYVYRNTGVDYHPFTTSGSAGSNQSPVISYNQNQSQVVLSLGYKF